MDLDLGVSGPLRNILKTEEPLKSSERCPSGQSHPWNCDEPASGGPIRGPSDWPGRGRLVPLQDTSVAEDRFWLGLNRVNAS